MGGVHVGSSTQVQSHTRNGTTLSRQATPSRKDKEQELVGHGWLLGVMERKGLSIFLRGVGRERFNTDKSASLGLYHWP